MIDSTMSSAEFPDWFVDLLLLRATDGLDEFQQQQFDNFIEEHPDRDRIELEAEKFELAVAATDLNYQNSLSREDQRAMPEDLRQKVLDGAKRHFDKAEIESVGAPGPNVNDDSGLTSREALAWLAAAAAVVLLLTGWNPFAAPNQQVAVAPLPSLEEQFDGFVKDDQADLIRLPWTATAENSIAGGEVVWRDSSQRGFMVFDGLPANNPRQSQYQLWIFDTDASQEHPVDGGVFDVDAGRPTIVPIDARIPIAKAVMFAITEERPGGVVVSNRKRLPLLAKVE